MAFVVCGDMAKWNKKNQNFFLAPKRKIVELLHSTSFFASPSASTKKTSLYLCEKTHLNLSAEKK